MDIATLTVSSFILMPH